MTDRETSWPGPESHDSDEIRKLAARKPKPYCTHLPPADWYLKGQAVAYLNARELPPSLAWGNGWYPSMNAGDTWPRLVIPCYSFIETNKYWQARQLTDGPGLRYESPHGVTRGDAVVLVVPSDEPVGTCVVEGPMDALAAAGQGWLGIAMMGTYPPDEVLETVKKLREKNVLIVADEGKAGIEAACRWAMRLEGAEVVMPTPYKDLAEMPAEERKKFLCI